MNKKLSMLIVIAASLLSIMIIAVWTTTGESSNPIPINSIEILGFDYLNDDGEKVKNIKELVNENNLTFNFNYLINPEIADDNNLKVYSDKESVSVMIDVLDSSVYVFFGTLSGINSVTITLKDEKTNKTDEIILIFKIPDDIEIPDFD